MTDHRYIFVGGLHRSGTTVLAKCLTSHPLVSGLLNTGAIHDEGQFLQSVFHPAKKHGGPGVFAFDPRARLTEASRIATASNAEKLKAEWSRYWDTSKPYLLEKSPPNVIRTRFLQAMFPDSYFLLIMRHPIAVSYATRRFKTWQRMTRWPIHFLVMHWVQCHRLMNEDLRHLRRALVVKYEEFVENPGTWLDKIQSFLGLDPRPCGIDVSSQTNAKYFEHWRTTQRRWPGRSIAALTKSTLEKHVNGFGYSLDV